MSVIERLRRTAAAWTKETGASDGLAALLNEAANALAAQQDGGWRPIETAPKDEARLLVSDGSDFATAEFTNGRWVQSPMAWEGSSERGGLADLDFTPTHWMIPELPHPRDPEQNRSTT